MRWTKRPATRGGWVWIRPYGRGIRARVWKCRDGRRERYHVAIDPGKKVQPTPGFYARGIDRHARTLKEAKALGESYARYFVKVLDFLESERTRGPPAEAFIRSQSHTPTTEKQEAQA